MLAKNNSFFTNIALKLIETFLPAFNCAADNSAPKTGHRIMDNGRIEIIAVEDLKINDILRVLPGEPIPMDGEIVKGHTFVGQKAQSDAAFLVRKDVGDIVSRGTINRYGTVEMRVTRLVTGSTLAQRGIEATEYC